MIMIMAIIITVITILFWYILGFPTSEYIHLLPMLGVAVYCIVISTARVPVFCI